MGVIYGLKRASDHELEILQDRPKLIGRFLFDDDRIFEEDVSFFNKIKSFFKGASDTHNDVEFEARDEIDLDKSWHVLHFVLTSLSGDCNHPLNLIGREWPALAKIDAGQGTPPMRVSAANLYLFHQALDAETDEQIMARWNADGIKSADLYLGEALTREEAEGQEYVLENLILLRKFVVDCVSGGDGAVVFYS